MFLDARVNNLSPKKFKIKALNLKELPRVCQNIGNFPVEDKETKISEYVLSRNFKYFLRTFSEIIDPCLVSVESVELFAAASDTALISTQPDHLDFRTDAIVHRHLPGLHVLDVLRLDMKHPCASLPASSVGADPLLRPSVICLSFPVVLIPFRVESPYRSRSGTILFREVEVRRRSRGSAGTVSASFS